MTPIPDTNDRVLLTVEEMDARMKDVEFVHTFIQSGLCLLGCDVERKELLALAKEEGASVELSGETATRMKHGIVLMHPKRRPTFIATKPEWTLVPEPPAA